MAANYGQPALTDPSTDKLHSDFVPEGIAYYSSLDRLYADSGVSGVTGTSSGSGFTYGASSVGKRLIITKVIAYVYSASSTVPGTLSVGIGGTTDDIVAATAATGVNAVGKYVELFPKSGALSLTDGQTITYAWAGWTGTTSLKFVPCGFEV